MGLGSKRDKELHEEYFKRMDQLHKIRTEQGRLKQWEQCLRERQKELFNLKVERAQIDKDAKKRDELAENMLFKILESTSHDKLHKNINELTDEVYKAADLMICIGHQLHEQDIKRFTKEKEKQNDC